MNSTSRPSEIAAQIATVLDDNLHVSVPRLMEFEQALVDNPTDHATRRVYRDWLLDHGCQKRAEQLERELEDKQPLEYTYSVRPERISDWADF
jgi:uncharacterized protein (TIGR02996 family)